MKAIETKYAGCRFRSRLEARWAVFFNAMGIEWEYEPQGFEFSWRLGGEGTFNYLPDFWLPQFEVWAEVKGILDQSETERLVNAAASLSSNDEGGCHDAGGHDMVVLGPVPRNRVMSPVRLHMHKGDLMGTTWDPEDRKPVGCAHGMSLVSDNGDLHVSSWARLSLLLLQGAYSGKTPSPRKAEAYDRARMARFEHGERG